MDVCRCSCSSGPACAIIHVWSQEDHPQYWSLLSPVSDRMFGVWAVQTGMAHLWASWDFPASSSCVATEHWDSRLILKYLAFHVCSQDLNSGPRAFTAHIFLLIHIFSSISFLYRRKPRLRTLNSHYPGVIWQWGRCHLRLDSQPAGHSVCSNIIMLCLSIHHN